MEGLDSALMEMEVYDAAMQDQDLLHQHDIQFLLEAAASMASAVENALSGPERRRVAAPRRRATVADGHRRRFEPSSSLSQRPLKSTPSSLMSMHAHLGAESGLKVLNDSLVTTTCDTVCRQSKASSLLYEGDAEGEEESESDEEGEGEDSDERGGGRWGA